MNKEEYFLDLFNKLDEYLRIKHFNNHSAYTSYVKKIFYIKNHRMNPIIENNHNFDLLKKAGEIRNIIAHNNDIIIPSDSFLEEFETLVNEIMKPKKVFQIMTNYSDLQTRDINDTLEDAISLIKEKGYSSIPILDQGKVFGMFTEKSIFDYLSMENNYEINKTMSLSAIKDAIDLDNNPRHYFKYIPRDMTVYEAYEIFSDDFKAKRELVLLLVSETGKSTEKILGIVALRDLKNLLYK
ncbi:MAG: CBS domain-containing protein [Candidatus Izimaplasma sp.]|nr:CBS domain-containing protein [Candidatus Izimaplasma bacterium]